MLNEVTKRIMIVRKQSSHKVKAEDSSKAELQALTLLKAQLINNSKAKKPVKELDVVKAYKKTLSKSAKTYQDNNLVDVAKAIEQEILYISQFLPKELSEAEVVEHVTNLFNSGNFHNMTMGVIIGKIRGVLKEKTSNGKLIADTVKDLMQNLAVGE